MDRVELSRAKAILAGNVEVSDEEFARTLNSIFAYIETLKSKLGIVEGAESIVNTLLEYGRIDYGKDAYGRTIRVREN